MSTGFCLDHAQILTLSDMVGYLGILEFSGERVKFEVSSDLVTFSLIYFLGDCKSKLQDFHTYYL